MSLWLRRSGKCLFVSQLVEQALNSRHQIGDRGHPLLAISAEAELDLACLHMVAQRRLAHERQAVLEENLADVNDDDDEMLVD